MFQLSEESTLELDPAIGNINNEADVEIVPDTEPNFLQRQLNCHYLHLRSGCVIAVDLWTHWVAPDRCVAACQISTPRPLMKDADSDTGIVTVDVATQSSCPIIQCVMNIINMHVTVMTQWDFTQGYQIQKTFQTLFEEIPSIESECEANKGRNKSIRCIDEFLLVPMWLKLGLVIAGLSFRFSMSRTSVSRIVDQWMKHLYIHLSLLTYWPTRQQINNTMPSDFKELFPSTRVVIDCTELFTETPRSLARQSMMWR